MCVSRVKAYTSLFGPKPLRLHLVGQVASQPGLSLSELSGRSADCAVQLRHLQNISNKNPILRCNELQAWIVRRSAKSTTTQHYAFLI
ncbi:hypothetical protein MVEN_00998400 [Mycena venus]|uniref:Uncharacterized protein n=1 Tax=Mycena venus TaxID=2733690 RepID=A0A8H6YCT4_9AGAR|nr:hypothetical protein MVEN_00998400 [Mycena venus]